MRPDTRTEWLEPDGLGGFASGTTALLRTRRYHALLLAAATPPTGRFVLVQGLDQFVTTPAGTFPLSAQNYAPGVVHPDGRAHLKSFTIEPWPRWRFVLPDGTAIEQAVAVIHGRPVVTVTWRLLHPRRGVMLAAGLLMSGRDSHALHYENRSFRFAEERAGPAIILRPYAGVPAVAMVSNGDYEARPLWYRNFLYEEERARGFDHVEDLASPGRFVFDLSRGEAALALAAGGPESFGSGGAGPLVRTWRARERRRRERFPTRLQRAADAYVVARGNGRTVVAGYPWFSDWGRDTFIALRGLCLATGQLDEARDILLEWSRALSRGMLPNRFPDRGVEPEYNAVDASLWYVVAVHDYRAAMKAAKRKPAPEHDRTLHRTSEAILAGYAGGTRYGIKPDGDGLLAAGEPGVPLTWMDARVGDRAVTPRIGKPVEVQALWINALLIGGGWSERWRLLHDRALASFRDRFPVPGEAYLYDVVDDAHQPGRNDTSFRPNQILAIGGLPVALLEGQTARAVVDAVEARLLTPLGLRTLDPADPAYRPRYEGGVAERACAYHQGTVWPWLLGPFVEAWVRVRGGTREAKRNARRRFIEPLALQMESAGLEHLPEIADGEAPHRARGCPFQAWSVGEILRLSLVVLNA